MEPLLVLPVVLLLLVVLWMVLDHRRIKVRGTTRHHPTADARSGTYEGVTGYSNDSSGDSGGSSGGSDRSGGS